MCVPPAALLWPDTRGRPTVLVIGSMELPVAVGVTLLTACLPGVRVLGILHICIVDDNPGNASLVVT